MSRHADAVRALPRAASLRLTPDPALARSDAARRASREGLRVA